MSVLEWKKFNFFRLIPIENRNIKHVVNSKVIAYTCNSIYKILCDEVGYVHIFFRNWESVSFNTCTSSIILCSLSKESHFLLTLSSSESANVYILKAWDLNKLSKRQGAPCIGVASISSLNISTALNVFCQNNLFHIAVGFERGEITVFRGLITREFTNGFRSFQACNRRITGIEFMQKSTSLNLFVCSDSGIFVYQFSETNDVRETKFVLDCRSEPTSCCALQSGESSNQYFIVGRKDAVYCYTTDGRGPCYAIEGQKQKIAWFSNYLVISIYQEDSAFSLKKKCMLVIIDITHKMIVLSKTMDSISGILIECNNCFVFTEANDVFAVYEKDLNSKLKLLLDKQLYNIALQLIEHDTNDKNKLADVYKLYGDQLYIKNEYSASIEKYIKTIGFLEPYYIIKKFLNSKLVCHLLVYLDALLKTNFATEEHIQLFISCNSRIHLSSKIDEILNNANTDKNICKDVYCNINEMICRTNMLRQINIKQNQLFDISLKRFVSLIHNKLEMEQFFSQFNEVQIYDFFKEHGHTLISFFPYEITEILKHICSNNSNGSSKNFNISNPEFFLPILIGEILHCQDFLEHIITIFPECNEIIYSSLFEVYLRKWKINEYDGIKLKEFLNLHYRKFNLNHILILCKTYSYWDGVLYIFQNYKLYNLSIRFYIRSYNVKHIYHCYQTCVEENPKILVDTINNVDFVSNDSVVFLNYLLVENMKKRVQSPLQVLGTVSGKTKSQVSHVKEFCSQEHIKFANDFELASKIVINLKMVLYKLYQLLNKYSLNPIEFRNNICEICKQQLSHPVVYFLCQHTYHKHCLNIYSGDRKQCITCETNQNKFFEKINGPQNSLTEINGPKNLIIFISNYLRSGIHSELRVFGQDLHKKENFLNKGDIKALDHKDSIKKIPTSLFKNPFEEEHNEVITTNPFDQYDANLNPFEE